MSMHTDVAPFQPLYIPGPVCYRPEHGGWQVTTYADAVSALRLQHAVPAPVGREGAYEGTFPLLRAMWARDGAAHVDLRHMTAPDFRTKAITPIISATRQMAHELLSRTRTVPTGRIELVEEYAVPLARYAICDRLLGISSEEPWLRAWQESHPSVWLSDDSVFQLAFEAWTLGRGTQEGPPRLVDKLIACYHAGAPVGASPMSLNDLMSYFDMLAVGAYESLRTNLATALVTLIEHQALPELREQRDNAASPALLASATEEVLRYAPSFPCIYLTTRTEVALGGQAIPSETILMVWVSAANRDPAVYNEPDQFDLWRYFDRRLAPRPPLSFGYGMHHCLGAELSRGIIAAAMEAFLDLVPIPVRLVESPIYYDYYGADHSIKQASIVYGEHTT